MNNQSFCLPLVCRSVAGDRDAVELLLMSMKETIACKISNMAGCCEDAEDIIQDVMIRLFRSIESLKCPEAFGVWLNRLICTEYIRYRTARSKSRAFGSLEECGDLFEETNPDCIPTVHAEQRETQAELTEALEHISKRFRKMVVMYYNDGMGYREIADNMGMTIGTVSANMFRAKKKLREELRQF